MLVVSVTQCAGVFLKNNLIYPEEKTESQNFVYDDGFM